MRKTVEELLTFLTMACFTKVSYAQNTVDNWTESQLNSLSSLISDLSMLDNTEIHLIANFSSSNSAKRAVLSRLANVPLFSYDLTWLENHQHSLPSEPCPIFGTGHGAHDEHGGEEEDVGDLGGHHPKDAEHSNVRKSINFSAIRLECLYHSN